MSIRDLNDWNTIELKAQLAEAGEVHCETVPAPSTAQQLAFATTYCAELKARLFRLQGKALEAQMWLNAGQVDRATQAVNAIIIDV